ncbi:MAG: hypothetical protein ABI640_02575 [Gammaproteobacteria bacterium]
MSTNDFVRLMNDPAHVAHERETREREAREQHDRRVARGSHEASGGVKPTAQQLRDSVTKGRAVHFEQEMGRRGSISAPKGTRSMGGKRHE